MKPWTLKLAIYPTDERISFINNQIFKGNILECIEKAYRYIIENTRWQAEIRGLERVKKPEIPLEAIKKLEYVEAQCDGDKITLTKTTPTEAKGTKKSLEEKINELDPKKRKNSYNLLIKYNFLIIY